MNEYQKRLCGLMDKYAHEVYKVTKKFPKEEMYGITSQFRRASLSVPLNFIEGYSRIKNKVKKNFFEISYGSLQESKYLTKFCYIEKLINKNQFNQLIKLADEIGAMLYTIIKK